METPRGKIACSKGGIGCDFDNIYRFVERIHFTIQLEYHMN